MRQLPKLIILINNKKEIFDYPFELSNHKHRDDYIKERFKSYDYYFIDHGEKDNVFRGMDSIGENIFEYNSKTKKIKQVYKLIEK